ncbi:MAG: UDP-N-acetylglucosamine 2-epimerase (non-hydrolyzing) [Ruminococcaceae bacterium]|nr:UDP-N-acetylglucosamine 2-epimerase (non-hydrolyzing) [Oscillospiraceae bacterium]
MIKTTKKKILCVFGTRPEAIKMCPLVNELKKREDAETLVCVTGQHREMLDGVLRVFCVSSDFDLSVMREGQSLSYLTSAILCGVDKVICEARPDIVLVHGDTITAFASALSAFYRKIPVAHIEAGLRSGDMFSPFPEEFDRRAISLLSSYHFAPTNEARMNLISEEIPRERIFVTGNTVTDAIKFTVKKDISIPEFLESSLKKDKKMIIFTAHRRENLGAPMENMLRALVRVVKQFSDVFAVCPLHKNPGVRETAQKFLFGHERIFCIEPPEVDIFHNLLARSHLILTDSGGIQEEAAFLGKPALVMRNVTERQEGIDEGVLRLVGTDEENIFKETAKLLSDDSEYNAAARPTYRFGDGRASARICDILLKI